MIPFKEEEISLKAQPVISPRRTLEGRPLYTMEDIELLARAENLTDEEIATAIQTIVTGLLKSETDSALEHMNPDTARALTIQGYEVLSDLPSEKEFSRVVKGYELVKHVFDRTLPGFYERRSTVLKNPTFIIFRNMSHYREYCRDGFGPSRLDPMGHYTADTRTITLTAEPWMQGEAIRALVHESVHDLVRWRITPRHGQIPRWLDEGIATLYEGTIPWQQKGGPAHFFPSLKMDRGIFQGALSLNGMGRAASSETDLKDNRFPELAQLFEDTSWEDMDVQKRGRYYNASFMFVHYLMYGENLKHRKAFSNYLKKLSKDSDAPLPKTLNNATTEKNLHNHIRILVKKSPHKFIQVPR